MLTGVEELKSKMSSGEGGVLMKILKDVADGLLKLLNLSAIGGMSERWKLAKSGAKNDIDNYRAIANLHSHQ